MSVCTACLTNKFATECFPPGTTLNGTAFCAVRWWLYSQVGRNSGDEPGNERMRDDCAGMKVDLKVDTFLGRPRTSPRQTVRRTDAED